jgi:hypothetical protein
MGLWERKWKEAHIWAYERGSERKLIYGPTTEEVTRSSLMSLLGSNLKDIYACKRESWFLQKDFIS